MAPYEPIPVHRHPTDASPIRELSTCDVYTPDAPASNPSMAAPNVDPGLLGDPSQLTIWKFRVEVADEAPVQVLNARLIRWLHAEPVGHAALYAWALVRQQPGHTDQRSVFVRGTGHPFTGREGYHFATVQTHPLVWHLFADQQAVVL